MSQVTEQSVRFQTALASIKLIQASAVLDLTEDDLDFLLLLSLLLPSLLIMFIPSTFKRPVSSWKALNLRKTLLMASSVRLKPLDCSRLPGVFAHGDFDTWSPSYLMFIVALHNGISRLYETFRNGGADTLERKLDPEE